MRSRLFELLYILIFRYLLWICVQGGPIKVSPKQFTFIMLLTLYKEQTLHFIRRPTHE